MDIQKLNERIAAIKAMSAVDKLLVPGEPEKDDVLKELDSFLEDAIALTPGDYTANPEDKNAVDAVLNGETPIEEALANGRPAVQAVAMVRYALQSGGLPISGHCKSWPGFVLKYKDLMVDS